LGCFIGEKTGHSIHNALLRALFANTDAWVRITAPYDLVPEPWLSEAVAVNA
jgi:UDP-3-O-acyl-N-acetylglucosamine deacetylase